MNWNYVSRDDTTSAGNRWVTFWVTQKSHPLDALIPEEFIDGIQVLSRAPLVP